MSPAGFVDAWGSAVVGLSVSGRAGAKIPGSKSCTNSEPAAASHSDAVGGGKEEKRSSCLFILSFFAVQYDLLVQVAVPFNDSKRSDTEGDCCVQGMF